MAVVKEVEKKENNEKAPREVWEDNLGKPLGIVHKPTQLSNPKMIYYL